MIVCYFGLQSKEWAQYYAAQMVRLCLFVCPYIHIDTYICRSLLRSSRSGSFHIFCFTQFISGRIRKSALTFVACPRTYTLTHTHTHLERGIESERRSHGFIVHLSWEIRRKKNLSSHRSDTYAHIYYSLIHSRLRRRVKYHAHRHCMHGMSVVQKRQRIKIKYRQLLTATHSHIRTCKHKHACTHTLPLMCTSMCIWLFAC